MGGGGNKSSGGSGGGGGGNKPGSGGGANKSGGGGGSSNSKPGADPNGVSTKGDPTPGKPGRPILLDLDGDGIEITELSRSNVFVDAGGDGLLHRTAWAGAGDGVLFFDVNGDNRIGEQREYVFTAWDPTATSDLAALRAAFDTNGDGKLTAADQGFAQFKVMVTNADGAQTARTLAELGITEISLIGDATHITLPDGTVISGQSTFLRADGTVGTVADAILMAEAEGRRVVQTATVDAAGNRTVTSEAYEADGSLAITITSVTSANGLAITNSYDDNGDRVIDRIQTITTAVAATGARTETVTSTGNERSETIDINGDGLIDSRTRDTFAQQGTERVSADGKTTRLCLPSTASTGSRQYRAARWRKPGHRAPPLSTASTRPRTWSRMPISANRNTTMAKSTTRGGRRRTGQHTVIDLQHEQRACEHQDVHHAGEQRHPPEPGPRSDQRLPQLAHDVENS